jgi:carbonic anhydrase
MSHEARKFDLVSLLKNLDACLEDFEKSFPLAEFAAAHYQQHPFITLLTCCDARVPPAMLGDTFNRVFCVENIGNQFESAEGSVLYGLLHLQPPLMVVAGHSECGAIKAATSDYQAEPAPLVKELNTVRGSLEQACTGMKVDLSAAKLSQAQLSEVNVDVQIEKLMANPEVAPLIANNALQIIGIVLDLHNVYGEGYGKIYTVNVNGEKNPARISQLDKIGGFSARVRRLPA